MSEFPVLCSQCLGEKDHVKMVRQVSGEQCKLCTRPFTVFRWSLSGEHKQSKKTIFCYTCAQSRNCCQSCMVDIDYGIPLDIRDAALKMAGVENPYAMGGQSRNAEVKALMADKLESREASVVHDMEEKKLKAKAILETLSSKLSSTNVIRPKQRDVNISKKDLGNTISKLPFGGTLETPEDLNIKSFFVFGFSDETPQYTITSLFQEYGTLASVKIIHQARCGFVSFAKRSSAEECAMKLRALDKSKNKRTAALLFLDKKEPVRVSWGVPRQLGNTKEEQKKIAIVVSKVLKQLAEKDSKPRESKARDSKSRDSGSRGNTSTEYSKAKVAKADTKKAERSYKSMAPDFEV